MDNFFRDSIYEENYVIYIDDIIISTEGEEAHNQI